MILVKMKQAWYIDSSGVLSRSSWAECTRKTGDLTEGETSSSCSNYPKALYKWCCTIRPINNHREKGYL